jgi:hypothetical protein
MKDTEKRLGPLFVFDVQCFHDQVEFPVDFGQLAAIRFGGTLTPETVAGFSFEPMARERLGRATVFALLETAAAEDRPAAGRFKGDRAGLSAFGADGAEQIFGRFTASGPVVIMFFKRIVKPETGPLEAFFPLLHA